jgi:methionine-rich copper-binding protein CopC
LNCKYLIIPFLMVALFLLLTSAPAFASPGLGVIGALIVKDVAPGEPITHTMTVSIGEDGPAMHILVDVMGWGQSLNGTPQKLEEDTSHYSIREHVTVSPTEFDLVPGNSQESQEVIVTINVPKEVGEGGRYALIHIYSQPTGEGQVGVVSAVDVPVALTISNTTLTKTGEITDLTVGEIASGEPITVSTILKNSGNHHYKAMNKVTLTDSDDNVLATASTPLSNWSIIPTYSRQFDVSLMPTQELPAGTYYVTSEVTLEDGTVLDTEETSFHMGPWTPPPPPAPTNWAAIGGGIGGGIVVVGLLTYFLVIRRRRARKV